MKNILPELGPPLREGEAAVEIIDKNTRFENFARVDVYRLRSRNFDGSMTEIYDRDILSIGPNSTAAVILPYDPVRDVVVLIEQLRLPSFITKRSTGWSLEPVAGLIETGDDPETTARRESIEEAGLKINRTIKVGHYLPSPGAFTEVIHLFIGEVTAGNTGQIHGLAHEHENIRSHIMSFAHAIALVDANQIENGNCLIALNWLARHRERIRAEWLTNR